jgi:selenocysteine lyase/cysteine desulfurase
LARQLPQLRSPEGKGEHGRGSTQQAIRQEAGGRGSLDSTRRQGTRKSDTDADEIRAKAARLINAEADDIAFIPSAGAALGWLINGINWKPGDEILSLQDEFPNNIYYPKVLEERGVRFVELPLPAGEFSPKDFLARISDSTRLVLLSAVNYSSGLRPPLAVIGEALRDHPALFCVDGTQSVGALRMDVRSIGADMVVAHGYKWLLCPTGIGFAYIRPQVREWLEPSTYSWRSHRNWRDVDSLHHGRPELPGSAMKYEGGVQNFPGIYALGAVLDLLFSIGPEEIENRVLDLVDQTRYVLRERGGQLLSDRHPHYDSAIVAAEFPNADMSALAVELKNKQVAVAARKGRLRVSPHFFNNADDIEQLDRALRGFLPLAPR